MESAFIRLHTFESLMSFFADRAVAFGILAVFELALKVFALILPVAHEQNADACVCDDLREPRAFA